MAAEKKQRSNMATARFGSGKGNTLRIEFNEVEGEVEKIKIHLVRVYNDGETIISLLNLKIGNNDYFYTTVTNEQTGPAREGQYLAYLIRRNDKEDKDDYHPDSQKMKSRIVNVFKNLKKFDERLPDNYKSGKENYNYGGHNGLRIFQKNMPYKVFYDSDGEISWVRLNGGNRFFHVANYSYQVIGCEGVGTHAEKNSDGDYGVKGSSIATADFLDKIIKVYEENIKKEEQSIIEIDINVEDNIQADIIDNKISPESLYQKLYPRDKVKSIDVKPEGFNLPE